MGRRLGRWAVAAGVVVAMVTSASSQSRPWPLSPRTAPPTRSRSGDWVADLREWVEAVRAHTPGSADGQAFIIGAWSADELSLIIDRLKAIQARFPRAMSRPANDRTIRYDGRSVDLRALQLLFGLSDEEARRGDVSRLVIRGAMLHADIAMRLDSRGAVQRSILVSDGRYQGMQLQSDHWGIGRLLLDLVQPSPASNDIAGLWYRATAAYLLSRLDYAESVPHLTWARQRFPTDAELAYDSGRLQESFSSARIQGAVSSAASITGLRPGVSSAETHVKAAEPMFRRAVELKPEFAEARLRLGRTLGVLGRHDEAVMELGRVVGESDDTTTVYLAHMFLGDEHQALGHRDEAASHYLEAASLFLDAQSPHLALAQLARRHGDRGGALRAIARVVALPADVDQREDPWWTYFDLPTDVADALVDELCGRVAGQDVP